MTIARRLIAGRDGSECFLSLTDADVVSMSGLSAEALGEVPVLDKEVPEGSRGENFGDARKWLGRALGWFQFAAVSLRAALDGAETEDVLRERLGGNERRLERILHAVSFGIRHASGPYTYLADGRGDAIEKHVDALLTELSGASLHRLEIEEARLQARLQAAGFACDGAKARIRELVGDIVDENMLEGLGNWNGSWHSDKDVVSAWAAWCAGISMRERYRSRLGVVRLLIADIDAGVRAEIMSAVEAHGISTVSGLASVLEISEREVKSFAEGLVEQGSLLLVKDDDGMLSYELP